MAKPRSKTRRLLHWLAEQPDGAAQWFPVELQSGIMLKRCEKAGYVYKLPRRAEIEMVTWQITDAGRAECASPDPEPGNG
jgi:hypothetical protein